MKKKCNHTHTHTPSLPTIPLGVAASIEDEPPNDRVPDTNSLGQVL